MSRALVLEVFLLCVRKVLGSLVISNAMGALIPQLMWSSWIRHWGCNCCPLDNQDTQGHVLKQQLLFCCQLVVACAVDLHPPCA